MGDRLGILGAVGFIFFPQSKTQVQKEGENKIKDMPRVRLELTAFRLWDWRAAYCATEAGNGWRKWSLSNFLSSPFTAAFNLNMITNKKNHHASAGNRTRVNCLEGSYAHHYTTDASIQDRYQTGIIFGKSRVKVKSLFKMSLPWPGFEPGLLRPQRRVLTTRRSRLETPKIVNIWVWYHTLKVICKEGKPCFNYIQRTSFRGVAVITSA